MDFKIGYSVRPKEVINTNVIFEKQVIKKGLVTYEDILPTKDECQAYGFNWAGVDTTRPKVCTINTPRDLPTANNRLSASVLDRLGNSVDNILTVGREHVIHDGVNNSIITGRLAEATTDNSIIIGGNSTDVDTQYPPLLGQRQAITLLYGATTSDGNTKASYLNNTIPEYFIIPDNTAMYFNAEILALRVGGSAREGGLGDYSSWLERGVVINKGGTLSIKRTRKKMSSDGAVTNWRPTASIGASDNFYIAVRGDADATIEWVSTIRFTQLKAGIILT
jgi:hypothetical protein